MVNLILASQSPRRRALIALLGQQVRVVTAGVDEESVDVPDPRENVIRTALLKARAVAASHPNAVVIAADTTVAVDGNMLGKPVNAVEARHMLTRLRGRAHQVHTGLVLLQRAADRQTRSVSSTDVIMRDYSDEEIARYIESGDPFDKAGAYAIQHSGFSPVSRIRGCYSNVVGLALCQLQSALRGFGVTSEIAVAEAEQDYRKCAACLALMGNQEGVSGMRQGKAGDAR
jgi:septum formation protein